MGGKRQGGRERGKWPELILPTGVGRDRKPMVHGVGMAPADTVKRILSAPSKYIAIITSAWFILSLCYNFGFFCIGMHLNMGLSHISIADYVDALSFTFFYILYLFLIFLFTHISFGIFDENPKKHIRISKWETLWLKKTWIFFSKALRLFKITILSIILFGLLVVMPFVNNVVTDMVNVFNFSSFIFSFLFLVMIIFSLRRRLLSFFFACIVLFSITIGFSDARVAAQSKSTLCKMIYAEERYEGDEGENLHVLRILSDDVLVVRDCRNISMRPTEFDCKVEFIRRELVARMVFSAGDEGKTPPSSDLGDQSHYGMRVRQNEKSEAVSHLLQRVPCR